MDITVTKKCWIKTISQLSGFWARCGLQSLLIKASSGRTLSNIPHLPTFTGRIKQYSFNSFEATWSQDCLTILCTLFIQHCLGYCWYSHVVVCMPGLRNKLDHGKAVLTTCYATWAQLRSVGMNVYVYSSDTFFLYMPLEPTSPDPAQLCLQRNTIQFRATTLSLTPITSRCCASRPDSVEDKLVNTLWLHWRNITVRSLVSYAANASHFCYGARLGVGYTAWLNDGVVETQRGWPWKCICLITDREWETRLAAQEWCGKIARLGPGLECVYSVVRGGERRGEGRREEGGEERRGKEDKPTYICMCPHTSSDRLAEVFMCVPWTSMMTSSHIPF